MQFIPRELIKPNLEAVDARIGSQEDVKKDVTKTGNKIENLFMNGTSEVIIDGMLGHQCDAFNISDFDLGKCWMYIKKMGTPDYYLLTKNVTYYRISEGVPNKDELELMRKHKFIIEDTGTGDVFCFDLPDQSVIGLGSTLQVGDNNIKINSPMILSYGNKLSDEGSLMQVRTKFDYGFRVNKMPFN